MPYAYLLDGTYDRSYFGELPKAEAERVANHRREHCIALEAFFRNHDYDFYSCSPEGHVSSVTTLDRGASKDCKTDFILLARETADVFLTHIGRD